MFYKYVQSVVLKFNTTFGTKCTPKSGRSSVKTKKPQVHSVRAIAADVRTSISTVHILLTKYKFHPFQMHFMKLNINNSDRRLASVFI